MFWTNLSGGRNFIFGTMGPPIRLSMKEGISNSGIASFGISEPIPACPAAFFRLGAEDRTTLPSYK